MIFKDISNFENTADYLPILNGCLTTEVFILFFVFHNLVFKSKFLKGWYKKYELGAVLADVIILFIGMILTRFFYHFIFSDFCIWRFIGLAVGIQIIHDFFFYQLFKNVPVAYSGILSYFKKYAGKVGAIAMIADSLLIALTALLSSYFAGFTLNTNIVTLVVSLYFIPFILYM